MIEVPVIDRLGADARPATGHGGPPRFFALCVTSTGAALAGTCERGMARRTAVDGEWLPVDAPLGDANVNAIVGSDGALYAAAGVAGVLRSTDDGATWERIGPDDCEAYAVHADDARIVVGTGDGLRVRPTDGVWMRPTEGPASTIYRLLPLADGRLLAGTAGEGLWSGDVATWLPSGSVDWPIFSLAELSSGRLLAGTRGGGVLVSDDHGTTWHDSNVGLPDLLVHALVVDGATVLAGTGRGIARSTDGGARWEQVGGELALHRIFSLAVSESSVYAGSYEGVWVARRGGPWVAVDTGLSAGESFAVAAAKDDAYAGVARGAFRSTDDGSSWVECSSGIDADAVFTFCFASNGDVLAGTDDGVRRRTVSDPLWVRAGLDGMRVFTVIEPEPGFMLAGTLGNGIHRFEADAGWRPSNDGLPFRMAYDLLRSPSSGHLFAATGDVAAGEKTGGIFRSLDEGMTWSALEHDPLSVYRVVETSGGVLFGGAQRSCILRSFDGGDTWDISRPTGLVDSKIYCLIVDATDRLFLGSGAQLLCTEDLGQSWMIVGDGLDGVTVYELANCPSGALLASTTSGMFRSVDNGLTFQPAPWPARGSAGHDAG